MNRAAIALVAVMLGGCATSAANTELQAADANLQAHNEAPMFINVDLVQVAGTTEAQREPQVRHVRPRVDPCADRFREGFVSTLDAAAARGLDGLTYALERARGLDDAFDTCARQAGLIGRMEFKVGERFMGASEFLRSYWNAGLRQAQAREAADREATANGFAFAASIGAAGRAVPAYQPPPPATFQRPIQCRSYRFGTGVNTACQ